MALSMQVGTGTWRARARSPARGAGSPRSEAVRLPFQASWSEALRFQAQREVRARRKKFEKPAQDRRGSSVSRTAAARPLSSRGAGAGSRPARPPHRPGSSPGRIALELDSTGARPFPSPQEDAPFVSVPARHFGANGTSTVTVSPDLTRNSPDCGAHGSRMSLSSLTAS